MLLEVVSEDGGRVFGEAVNSRGDGALVSQVSGNAPFVLGAGATDESRVEDQAVFGSVTAGLQGSVEERSKGGRREKGEEGKEGTYNNQL